MAEWRDVTDLFISGSEEMEFSELISSDKFSLFDAMSAMELMDPKMDPVDAVSTTDPNQLLVDGFLDTEMSLHKANCVVQHLLVCEVAWCEGSSLAETLFTCLYLQKPILSTMLAHYNSEDEEAKTPVIESLGLYVLYAIILNILKTTELSRHMILQADIYEEEDFSPNSFGFDLLHDMEETVMLTHLDAAESKLLKLDQQELSDADLDAKTLLETLRFRRSYYLLIKTLGAMRSGSLVDDLDKANKAVTACRTNLAFLSGHPLCETEDGEEASISAECYDPEVNRALLCATPTRVVRLRPRKEAWEFFTDMVKYLEQSITILNCETLEALQTLLDVVPLHSAPLLARSIVAMNLYVDDLLLARLPFRTVVAKAMVDFGVPKELSQLDCVDQFISRLVKPVYESLRLMTLNLSHQRLALESILTQWNPIQNEAHILDTHFRHQLQLEPTVPPHLSDWAMGHVCALMQRHIALGIELELFSNHEVAVVFWYWEYLLSMQIHTSMRAELAKAEWHRRQTIITSGREEAAAAAAGMAATKKSEGSRGGRGSHGSNKKKGKQLRKAEKKKKNNAESKDEQQQQQPLLLSDLRLHTSRSLCRGAFRILAALQGLENVGKVGQSALFTAPACRFKHRFKAYTVIQTPPCLNYEDFADQCIQLGDSPQQAHALLETANQSFRQAIKFSDKMAAMELIAGEALDDCLRFKKVAVANSMLVAKLLHSLRQTGNLSVTSGDIDLDYEIHNLYPVVKVVSSPR
eukprot:CAMPEP_0185764208 /NCGR_PEP_ID=MMETSP1174-20130828/23131_1 /TAXON_ID=35687 /ORGANISM="Dictyocha speculum, Strain CCMP1381" /LENGTH=751 /DNA_ID=CAMNT_0028446643 /DNA_START=3 /DNA_END=2258 /DNA_ORIENTATION=+